MKYQVVAAVALLFVGWNVEQARALGADHSKQELAAHGEDCVHGFWVNETDVFFYAGDAESFNAFAAKLAEQKEIKLRVALHQGSKKARSPWDKADRDIPVDWSVTTGVTGFGAPQDSEASVTRVDVWLGGKIKQDELKIPEGAEVTRIDKP